MPLYEYRCKECGAEMELLVRSTGEKPQCPKCKSKRLEKLLSVVATPTVADKSRASDMPTCGRPQCQSGCMFDS
ncbi:MAG: zinc ribbon domain-containing protein [Planctomycetota bacterium]|nr:MAG: zinc ribbon domain-containing protein [Planctomycetota bacterium]